MFLSLINKGCCQSVWTQEQRKLPSNFHPTSNTPWHLTGSSASHPLLIAALQRCSCRRSRSCCRYAAAAAAGARRLSQPVRARRAERGALVVGLHQLGHGGLIGAARVQLGGRQLRGSLGAQLRLPGFQVHLREEQVGLWGGDDPVQDEVLFPPHLLEHPAASLLLVLGLSGAQLGAEERLGSGLEVFPDGVLVLGRRAAVGVVAVAGAALHSRLPLAASGRSVCHGCDKTYATSADPVQLPYAEEKHSKARSRNTVRLTGVIILGVLLLLLRPPSSGKRSQHQAVTREPNRPRLIFFTGPGRQGLPCPTPTLKRCQNAKRSLSKTILNTVGRQWVWLLWWILWDGDGWACRCFRASECVWVHAVVR